MDFAHAVSPMVLARGGEVGATACHLALGSGKNGRFIATGALKLCGGALRPFRLVLYRRDGPRTVEFGACRRVCAPVNTEGEVALDPRTRRRLRLL